MFKNIFMLASSGLLLSACTLFSGPITGTDEQKAEKLAQIIERGGSADCQVTNLTDKSTVQYIVSGKKMKLIGSNFGADKKGTMINDAVYIYSWGEGDKTGFKMKLFVEKEIQPSVTVTTQDEFNTENAAREFEDETKYKLDCVSRVITDSEFVPPANVQFTDPSELNQMTPEELQKLYPQE